MSAECTGWVYRHSPARGVTLLVHLAVADSANDQNGYELWMRQSWLAAKARVSRRSVTDALAWLTENGLLELLEAGAGVGAPNRYRLLMPDTEAVWTPKGGAQPLPTPYADAAHPGTQPLPGGVRSDCAHRTKENPSGEPNPELFSRAATFDEFWAAYPRKADKKAAERAWRTAVRSASPEVIVAAAAAYAADPNRDERYTKYPATWLNAAAWGNGPLPSRRERSAANDDHQHVPRTGAPIERVHGL